MTENAIKILLATITTFTLAYSLSPLYIKMLNKHEMWKKKSVSKSADGYDTPITAKLHNDENKKVPRLGGAIIWGSVFVVASIFWLLSEFLPFVNKIDFISRNQTWLIIFGMVFTGVLGAIDDISSCGKKIFIIGDRGLSFVWRIFIVFLLSIFVAFWFYSKLGFVDVFIPFFGLVYIGVLIIPLIMIALVVMSAVSVIDGIDGLSGGLFAIAFASFGIIAVAQDQINIAAFCFAVVGACTAFLWFNIMPAKFYNSETGLLSLSTTLTLIAILTNQIFILPIIALPLLTGPISSFIQIFSKKFRGKKVFVVAPMHNHFQAIGIAGHTVVMKYWIFAIMCAYFGIILALAGRF
jgi:phospho-N-acetylmuramoyl-pentapeptide-transferase